MWCSCHYFIFFLSLCILFHGKNRLESHRIYIHVQQMLNSCSTISKVMDSGLNMMDPLFGERSKIKSGFHSLYYSLLITLTLYIFDLYFCSMIPLCPSLRISSSLKPISVRMSKVSCPVSGCTLSPLSPGVLESLGAGIGSG